jgi:hypothetical protein
VSAGAQRVADETPCGDIEPIDPLDMLMFMAQEIQEVGSDLAEKMEYIAQRIGDYKVSLDEQRTA